MSDDAKARGAEVYKKLGLPRGSGPALPEEFRAMTMEHLFGDVWGRPGLEIEQRSLITVTTLAALGREAQLHTHLHGALNLGWTQAQLEEVFMHLAHYAGWPAAVTAMTVLGNVVAERDAREAKA
jgi:4-carboxymuconolactone decarboxylase